MHIWNVQSSSKYKVDAFVVKKFCNEDVNLDARLSTPASTDAVATLTLAVGCKTPTM